MVSEWIENDESLTGALGTDFEFINDVRNSGAIFGVI